MSSGVARACLSARIVVPLPSISMKRFFSAFAVIATAAPALCAQLPAQRISGPITPLKLHASGEITVGEPWTASADVAATAFGNVTTAGLFALPLPGEEWVDWGTKAAGLTGVACAIEIGYATLALDSSIGGPGADFEVAIYAGTVGACGASDVATEAQRFEFTGLPGSLDGSPAAYMLEIELAKQTFALSDGAIGWSYVGVDGLTGPLLITVGADATGTADGFDKYTPAPAQGGACLGTFDFGTAGVGSFYLRIDEDDGSEPGSQTPRAGTGFNVGVLTAAAAPPKIGQAWTPSLTAPAVATPIFDFLAISGSASAPTIVPGFGELLIHIGGFDPLAVVAGPTGAGMPFSVPMPFYCSLVGASMTSQAGQLDASGEVGLTDALDFVIGI